MKTITKLWLLIIILIILAPIGLMLPEYFKAGAAWGEWGIDEIRQLAGYIPRGLERIASLWNAPMPDYAFKNWDKKPLPAMSLAYIISAVAGILVIVIVMLAIGKFLAKKE